MANLLRFGVVLKRELVGMDLADGLIYFQAILF